MQKDLEGYFLPHHVQFYVYSTHVTAVPYMPEIYRVVQKDI